MSTVVPKITAPDKEETVCCCPGRSLCLRNLGIVITVLSFALLGFGAAAPMLSIGIIEEEGCKEDPSQYYCRDTGEAEADMGLIYAGAACVGATLLFAAMGCAFWQVGKRRIKESTCAYCKKLNYYPKKRCARCWSPLNIGKFKCTQCQKAVRKRDLQCKNCGKGLFVQCVRCHHAVRIGAGACPECLEHNFLGATHGSYRPEVVYVQTLPPSMPPSLPPTVTNVPMQVFQPPAYATVARADYTAPPSASSSSSPTSTMLPPQRNSTDLGSTFLKGITVKEKLGQGSFGAVFRATWYQTVVALKSLLDGDREAFMSEVSTLQKLQHPNIVTFYGLFSDENSRMFMVTEYCDLLDLRNFLLQHSRELSVAQLVNAAKQGCAGMAYLYDARIYHRDLAARNLLVCSAGESQDRGTKFVVKVGDFGLARESSDHTYQPRGVSALPVRWSPIEVLKYARWYQESDIWSFGVVMFEIITKGEVPYAEMPDLSDVARYVMSGNKLGKPPGCPDRLYELMLACWKEEPTHRIPFSRLCEELADMEKELRKALATGEYATVLNSPAPIAEYANDQNSALPQF